MNPFSQGEVIVRNDLKYPYGALVVGGIDGEGCLPAEILASLAKIEEEIQQGMKGLEAMPK